MVGVETLPSHSSSNGEKVVDFTDIMTVICDSAIRNGSTSDERSMAHHFE